MAKIFMLGVSQLLRLFIDDGSLAVSLLAWFSAAYTAPHFLVLQYEWAGPVLFLGCIAILVENLLRASRKQGVAAARGATREAPVGAPPP